jgi:triosephosphate isomerase
MVTPQNCNFKGCGAFTGEMSVEQMKDLGMTSVLIGHSERRGEFGILPMDSNDTLATKLKYILDAGMLCIFCIGEPLSIREKGIQAVLKEMDIQMKKIYKLLDPAKVVIAYEPVWAIGTGKTASPQDAQETHAGIRKLIAQKASPKVAQKIRIQYGGSANAKNAPELSEQPDIDGFLVGGASLKPEFKEIVATISATKAAQEGIVDMKVTQKKSTGFYVNSAKAFFTGTTDKDGVKKEPVEVLKISGLGEAINTAVAAAAAVEKEGLATVKKIETSYPDMSEGQNRGCPRILITLSKK